MSISSIHEDIARVRSKPIWKMNETELWIYKKEILWALPVEERLVKMEDIRKREDDIAMGREQSERMSSYQANNDWGIHHGED
jgi:hypothetical protein